MNIVIIEDESAIANNLKANILSLRPNFKIVKILQSVEESLSFFKSNITIDIIFSDVTLLDGHCFEIFEKTALKCPIIFCTAYEQYALDAFETNGIDFMLKPYSIPRLEKSINKVEKLFLNLKSASIPTLDTILLVHYKGQIIPIEYKSIAIIYLKNNITYLKDIKNQRFLINSTLDELESRLNSDFFRINRQMIVNRSTIKLIEKDNLRKLQLKLQIDFEEEIWVGKVKAPTFLKWMEGQI